MNHARRKKAILTYHRIVDDGGYAAQPDGGWSFYDIRMPDFRRQVARLAAHMHAYNTGSSIPSLDVTFDDGTRDHLRAAELLAGSGISGIFFVITGRVGSSEYLSESDLQILVRFGHRLGSHTVTHRRITTLSAEHLKTELERSRDFLEQIAGKKIEWFAPPGGYLSDACLEAALACGYRFVRTMRWGYASTSQTGEVPCIPILPGTSDATFDQIINANASLFGFRLKEALKRAVGERTYVTLRNRLWASRHRA
jgi:peptidoglycan/xylan/chitin deacetylase (PgdA/CDA1 family)